MEKREEQSCRQGCLLDNKNIIVAVNLLLQELDGDLYRHGLSPCAECLGRCAAGQAEGTHERLAEIYNALLVIRDNIIEIRRHFDPQPNQGRPSRKG